MTTTKRLSIIAGILLLFVALIFFINMNRPYEKRIVGEWVYHGDMVIQFNPDGTFEQKVTENIGNYEIINKKVLLMQYTPDFHVYFKIKFPLFNRNTFSIAAVGSEDWSEYIRLK